MKIYGIGTDIVSVVELKNHLKKKFFKRIFSKEEVLNVVN